MLYNASELMIQTMLFLVNHDNMKSRIDTNTLYYIKTGESHATSRCFGEKEAEFGCYSLGEPWTSEHRPISLYPQPPEEINTTFCLYTRKNPSHCQVLDADQPATLYGSALIPGHPTYILVHGFIESGDKPWILLLRDRLLDRRDANVIIVDWGTGSGPPYNQAVANIRMVGFLTARLIARMSRDVGVGASTCHMIGHSLGAHLSGYVGYHLREMHGLILGRITGLDPAQPHFAHTEPLVRLDPTDAELVDVIHTDAIDVVTGGFGIEEPVGHYDFYPNGGSNQPGCEQNILSFISQEDGVFKGIKKFIGCNHVRAHEFFSESVLHNHCAFWAVECDSYDSFLNGSCFACSGPWPGWFIGWLTLVPLSLVIVHIPADNNVKADNADDNVFHIGGIFPIGGKDGWQGGQACEPAAHMALEDVNKRKDLSFRLKMHWNDSECEPGLGASVMFDLLYNKPQKIMLLAGCSTVCTTVAETAKMWNLVVLCYGASSPALSSRARFPTLFRTHPSAVIHNPTRIKLMEKFGWSRIAILQQAEEVFISTVEDLEKRCKQPQSRIEIVTRQSFMTDPTDAVKYLKRADARIIVGLFYVVAARRVLCEIYRERLFGKKHVWFFIGWYENNWFEQNLEKEGITCTAEEMRMAAEGHLTTEAVMWNQNEEEETISGMTSKEFRERLNGVLKKRYDIDHGRYPEGYQEAPLAYDAVWSVALAFNKTMEVLAKTGKSLKNFTYDNTEIANEVQKAFGIMSFTGVSGNVAFSSLGDRIALTQIEQLINGSYEKLGYYEQVTSEKDNLTWLGREQWEGGKPPQDRTIIRKVLRTLSLPLFICMWTISSIGIVIAIALIAFNVIYRHRRVIQSSHPVCNTIMLVGVITCLWSVFLLGLDGQFISGSVYPLVCQARAWLLSIGFTLAYGAMFSKVWRVHRLTTKTKADTKKKIEPWKLYTMVTGLLLVDLILLMTWQLYDPMQRTTEEFPLEQPASSEDDIKISPELEHCESENHYVWLGIMYGYKGVILVFGLFLAYETRSIKVKQINDSRYVGMSIYNVVVLCLITTPVTMVIASQQDAVFAFVSLAVIFCCFLSMALIFLPKVIEVIRHPRDKAESKYNPDVGSKEDEEKYRKIVQENAELQKLIAEKEERIRLLKQRLAEKDAKRGTGGSSTGPVTHDHSLLHTGSKNDTLIIADFITDAGTSDSAFGGGVSVYTRSSRASASDLDFSESYL